MATLEIPPELRATTSAARAAEALTRFLDLLGRSGGAPIDPGAAVVVTDEAGAPEFAATARFPREALEGRLTATRRRVASEIVLAGALFRMEPIAEPRSAWIVLPSPNCEPAVLAVARAAFALAEREREVRTLGAIQRAVLGGSDEGLITADASGRISFVSPNAARILGVSASEVLGRPSAEVVRTPRGDEDVLARGLEESVSEVELSLVAGDEGTVPVSLRLEPIPGPAGVSSGVVAVIRDVEQARRNAEQARARDRMSSLGELTAAVAHEVRNPLTAITASAQILRRRLSGEETQTALLDVILDETARLNRIVESMLQFAWQPRPRLARMDAGEVVERVLKLVEVAGSGGIRVEKRVAAGVPAVYADVDQIEQVLLNLVRNAQQAMSSGGSLTVAAEVAEQPAPVRRLIGRRAYDAFHPPESAPMIQYVEISVADTGPGIREEDLPRVFDPFFTTRRDGTGLGLSISQGIVQAHDGYLRLSSRVGVGTRVIVGLPVERRRGERRSR
jgi:PAS domain S-box-containing protein